MVRIIKSYIADIVSSLPEIQNMDITTFIGSNPDDLFVCALGFEPRCLSIPTVLADAGYRSRYASYFEYSTNRDDNAVNFPQLNQHLTKMSTVLKRIDADYPESSNIIRNLMELLIAEAKDRKPAITLDISSSANRMIMKLIKILLEYDVDLRIVYSEAALYHPTRSELDESLSISETKDVMGLERGVGNVEISVDYPGQHLDPLPDAVIVFPCFKPERSKAVLNLVDHYLLRSADNKVHWILGIPHLSQDHWRLGAMPDKWH